MTEHVTGHMTYLTTLDGDDEDGVGPGAVLIHVGGPGTSKRDLF